MLVVGVFGALLIHRSPALRARSLTAVQVLAGGAALVVLAEFVLSCAYLRSASYIDHIEPSVASIAYYFRHGTAVFPELSSYTFHGLLYGPLLAELTSLGYAVNESVPASKLVGWLAAWTSIGLIVLTSRTVGRGWPALAAVASAVCVLASFGHVLTWNRADPLLLLFATLALFAVTHWRSLWSVAFAGLLAGAAMDLKVHGVLYVAPALLVWMVADLNREWREWARAALLAAGAGIVGVVLPLVPANVSLQAYVMYLQLALVHGLSVEMFLWNFTFLIGLWLPVVLALRVARPETRNLSVFMIGLFATELIVTIIGSKPGAGTHHMLPFLGFHAWLLQRLLSGDNEAAPGESRSTAFAAVGLAAVLAGVAWTTAALFYNLLVFEMRSSEQTAMRTELQHFADRYPHGVMGVADGESYPTTFLRPWLTFTGSSQIEFGAFMDLSLSGVSDEPLAAALRNCDIPYIYLPKSGAPFTLLNGYDLRPLFSDDVRAAFGTRYVLTEPGRFFDVWACRR